MNEKLAKKRRVVIKSVVLLMLVISAALAVVIVGLPLFYNGFYQVTERQFKVPGMSAGFVPQGLEYLEQEGLFLISGYMAGDSSAHLFAVRDNGTGRQIPLQGQDGSTLKIHAGGVCVLNGKVYVAGGDCFCYVFLLDDVLDGGAALTVGRFATYNMASFCCEHNGQIFVGEFFSDRKYYTDESHHIITPYGNQNNAVMFAFDSDDTTPLGINEMPVAAYSIGNTVQGMCFAPNGEVVMSTSRNFADSQLIFYDFAAAIAETGSVMSVDGKTVQLYFIDRRFVLDSVQTLPKAEEITFFDNKIYIVFESAAERFQYGKLFRAQYIYSLELKD